MNLDGKNCPPAPTRVSARILARAKPTIQRRYPMSRWWLWFGRKTGCCPIRKALFETAGGTKQLHPCEPSRRVSIVDLPPEGRWMPFSKRRTMAETCKSPTARIDYRPPASTIPTADHTQNPVETPPAPTEGAWFVPLPVRPSSGPEFLPCVFAE